MLKEWHSFWIRRNKLYRLDLHNGYMGNIYPLYAILSGQVFLKGASYWIHGSNPLPYNMKYNTQFWDDPNIQNFIWGESSELKSENSKGEVYGGLYVRNQGTLNDENFGCRRSHIRIQFVKFRSPQTYIWYFGLIKPTKEVGRRLMLIPSVVIHCF